MGRRNQRQRQKGLWVAAADLPQTAAHPFYRRLNELLDEHGFDDFAEQRCEKFYAAHMGRPSLTPGSYFRCLLIGYLEGLDSERGIAWRLADSISLRRFLAIELDESTPDHSTISRTRRLIDVETHREVFTWVLRLLAKQGLLKAGTIAVDATTLEANAALRSIVRRDSGESYEEFLRGLAAQSGIETPSREQLAKLDKKRKNKGSNKDWTNLHDPDAKIAQMKDGRTHLAHKAEHAVDLETGALLALTVQGADLGDTTTVAETITAAAEQVAAVAQDREANKQLSPKGCKKWWPTRLSQQRRAEGPQNAGDAFLHQRAGPRAAQLVRQAARTTSGVWQPATDARGAGQTAVTVARRAGRTQLCSFVRDGPDAADALARPRKYLETAADSRRRVQLVAAAEEGAGSGHATRPRRSEKGL